MSADRKADEAARLAAIRAEGTVPEVCGDAYPVAPARGAFRVVDFMASYPKGADGFEDKPAGWQGRKTVVRADVFDVIEGQARRGKRAMPLTPTQVQMGRFYRDLLERYESAGLRGTSLETMAQGRTGGGVGGEFVDAVLMDRERLAVLRRRIGDGPAMIVRRVRPSARGSRTTITARTLVDLVCVGDMPVDAVLRRFGWAVKGETRRAAYLALGEALDRMAGPVRGGYCG